LVEHVALGFSFEAGAVTESNAPTASPDVTRRVDGASAFFIGSTFSLGGYLWLGPALVRADLNAGARHYSMNLIGYESATCRTSRGREYPCPETVTSTQPVLQPRLSLDATVGQMQGLGAVVVGPWVGLELVPSPTVSAGLSIGVLTMP
jgi:hypothetical protein